MHPTHVQADSPLPVSTTHEQGEGNEDQKLKAQAGKELLFSLVEVLHAEQPVAVAPSLLAFLPQ